MTDQSLPEYGIVCTAVGDKLFWKGAKCWIVGGTGGEGWHRFTFQGLSIGGRRVEKWSATRHFHRFRAAWVPPWVGLRGRWLYLMGTREEMEETAKKINQFLEEEKDLDESDEIHDRV